MKPTTRSSQPAPLRIDPLRNALLATVDALHRRRADLVSESLIEAYVAAFWMEWAGGTLKLTETGQNICKQLRAAARVA